MYKYKQRTMEMRQIKTYSNWLITKQNHIHQRKKKYCNNHHSYDGYSWNLARHNDVYYFRKKSPLKIYQKLLIKRVKQDKTKEICYEFIIYNYNISCSFSFFEKYSRFVQMPYNENKNI